MNLPGGGTGEGGGSGTGAGSTPGSGGGGYPHTVTVRPASEVPDPSTKVVAVPTFGSGVSVDCRVTPQKHSTMFYAHGLMLKRPHMLVCALDDGSNFHPGDEVTLGSRVFSVQTHAALYDTGSDDTSHANVILNEETAEEA